MKTSELLTAAKAKIEDEAHWCQNSNAKNDVGEYVNAYDSTACRWCANGAVVTLVPPNTSPFMRAIEMLNHAALAIDPSSEQDEDHMIFNDPYVNFNDASGRTHDDVMRMFRLAIELAEANEATA